MGLSRLAGTQGWQPFSPSPALRARPGQPLAGGHSRGVLSRGLMELPSWEGRRPADLGLERPDPVVAWAGQGFCRVAVSVSANPPSLLLTVTSVSFL